MKIEEILRTKGRDVVTIIESQSVLDAAQTLVDRNIGGLVVMEGERPTGIITEQGRSSHENSRRGRSSAPGRCSSVRASR